MMQILNAFDHPSYHAIGITLLHSIWQGLIIYVFYKLLEPFTRIKSAAWRYNFLLLLLGTLLAAVIFTLRMQFEYYQVEQLPALLPDLQILFLNSEKILTADTFKWNDILPLGTIIWEIGVFLLTMKLLAGIFFTYQWKNWKNEMHSSELINWIQELVDKWNISVHVELKITSHVNVPAVMGVMNPVIYLPLSMMTGLSEEQLKMIISHEMAHIKRWDFMINIFQKIIETLLFFNPFIWFLSNKIRFERECACDDFVLQDIKEPGIYARTLVQVEHLRLQSKLAVGLNGQSKTFKNRIIRIMGKQTNTSRSGITVLAVLVLTAFIFVSWRSAFKATDTSKLSVRDNAAAERSLSSTDLSPVISTGLTEIISGFKSFTDTVPKITAKEKEIEKKAQEISERAALAANEELLQKIESKMDFELDPRIEEISKEMAEIGAKLSQVIHTEMGDLEADFNEKELKALLEANEMKLKQLQKELESIAMPDFSEMEEAIKKMEFNTDEFKNEMKELKEVIDQETKILEELLQEMKDKISSELVKDGYLKKGEELEELRISDKGEIRVNDMLIKEQHSEKYMNLIREYFELRRDDFKIKW